MCYVPVCVTYLYVLRTCMCYVPVRVTYLYVLRTCTCYVPVRVTYLYVLNYVEKRDEIEKLSVSIVVKPRTDRHRKVGVKYVGSRRVVDYNAVLHRPS